jgi:hypothetical protein
LADATDLWKKNEFDKMVELSTSLCREHPGYAPALVLKGFIDLVFRGDLTEGIRTLSLVKAGVEASANENDAAFLARLSLWIGTLKMEVEAHKDHGTSDETLRKNASPSKFKELTGGGVPPLLELVGSCPSVILREEDK